MEHYQKTNKKNTKFEARPTASVHSIKKMNEMRCELAQSNTCQSKICFKFDDVQCNNL
jgi:hypothetical protein